MLAKNQTLTLECAALGADFEGICRHEGQVVFVRGALPGEQVRAKIIKTTRSYAVARLEALLTRAPDRAEPPCPYYPRCGGCTAQHLSYAATLAHKRAQVRDCLERIGGIAGPCVGETMGMASPWRYRNKGAFPVGCRADGRSDGPRIGCFAARSHDIVDAPQGCLLQSAQSDALVGAVRQWMAQCRVPPYEEARHAGLVRHVMTREAADGSAMLVVVVNGRDVPDAPALVSLARQAAPGLRSVLLNENTRRTNVILGERSRVLWGADALEDEIGGFAMRVSPRSFFQVNRTQAQRLYDLVLAMANLQGSERVWDVYCGCGSITLPLAVHASWVTGVEIVADAVADARENARRAGIRNVDFLAGAAEQALPLLARERGAPDVVVLDPPRKGCERAALDAIAQCGARRLVYVSCNPATLARDVGLLSACGWKLQSAQPVDMFPWTGHVETVVLLSKLNSKQHIEVELNLDELDLTAAESKATYDEIKAYVLEKHGLKVSSLYISQVKRKCGLDVGQNYNLSKKEDAKVPQCPPDKEAAIMEALKHFHMV